MCLSRVRPGGSVATKKYPPLVVVAKGAYVDSIKASSCGALGDDYEAKNQLHLLLLHPSMFARWRA